MNPLDRYIAEMGTEEQALEAWQSGDLPDAQWVAHYVLSRVARAGGKKVYQGVLKPPLVCGTADGPIRFFANHRLRGVTLPVHGALVGWALGNRPAVLTRGVPSPHELLALQAQGLRYVSVVEDGTDTGKHADPLAFVVHDLCHIEKFADPDHFPEQVGFFSSLNQAVSSHQWATVDEQLDPLWPGERDYVMADMNGSAVFLLLALKSRIRAATRRRWGVETAKTSPADVEQHYLELFEQVIRWMGMPMELTDDAMVFQARGIALEAGQRLRAHFQETGEKVLHTLAQQNRRQ